MFKLQNSYSLTQLNPPTAPLFSRCMHISPLRSPPVQKLKHPALIFFPTYGTPFFVLNYLSKQSIPALEETASEEGADEEDTKEQGAPVTNLAERTDE